MSLYNSIRYLYPKARGLVDFELVQLDDSQIVFARWNAALGPKPSIEQLRAVEATADLSLALAELRHERNRLLAGSDWTQLADAPLTKAELEAWAAYRKALRDMPNIAAGATAAPPWPKPPKLATGE